MLSHRTDLVVQREFGKVLAGLVKRIAEGATGVSIGTPEDVAAFKAARA